MARDRSIYTCVGSTSKKSGYQSPRLSERLVLTQQFLVHILKFELQVMPSFESCTQAVLMYCVLTSSITWLRLSCLTIFCFCLLYSLFVYLEMVFLLSVQGIFHHLRISRVKVRFALSTKLPYQLYLSNQHFATEMW